MLGPLHTADIVALPPHRVWAVSAGQANDGCFADDGLLGILAEVEPEHDVMTYHQWCKRQGNKPTQRALRRHVNAQLRGDPRAKRWGFHHAQ